MEIEKLEAAFKNDSRNEDVRLRLALAFKQALLEDVNSAFQLNLHIRLWKLCYYSVIDTCRKKPSVSKLLKDSLDIKDTDRLPLIIDEAMGSILQLMAKLCLKTGEHQLNLLFECLGFPSINYGSDHYHMSEPIRRVLFHLMIAIGDLVRYKAQLFHSIRNKDLYTTAEIIYQEAAKYFSQIGHAYNMLAVIHSHLNNPITAMYYYVRSFRSNEPSSTGMDNLLSFLKSSMSQQCDPKIKTIISLFKKYLASFKMQRGLLDELVALNPDITLPVLASEPLFLILIGLFSFAELKVSKFLDLLRSPFFDKTKTQAQIALILAAWLDDGFAANCQVMNSNTPFSTNLADDLCKLHGYIPLEDFLDKLILSLGKQISLESLLFQLNAMKENGIQDDFDEQIIFKAEGVSKPRVLQMTVSLMKNLKALSISFAPMSSQSNSIRTLLARVQTAAFKAASPNCQLKIECNSSVPEPNVSITFKDNKTMLLLTKNLDAQDIIRRIERQSKRLEEM